jgi:hypothetical protein
MRKQLTFFTMLFDVTYWAVWWVCGQSAVRVGIGWMDAGHCRWSRIDERLLEEAVFNKEALPHGRSIQQPV